MNAARLDRIATKTVNGVLVCAALLGVGLFIDWITTAGNFEVVRAAWMSFPYFMRLVVVCLAAGLVVMFGFYFFLVRSAVPVDENECPIRVKGKK